MASRPRAALGRLAVLLALAATPAAAQAAPAETTLAGRMGAFLEAMQSGDRGEIASFFPRRGDWDWVWTLTARAACGASSRGASPPRRRRG